ncbi:MAG: histidine kinase [Bacteroidota bacterium]
MKSRINIFLPIALAVILPLLSLQSSEGKSLMDELSLLSQPLTSIILYLLWHLIYYSRNAKSPERKRRWTIALVVYFGIISFILFPTVFKNAGEIEWLLIVRIIFATLLFFVIQYAMKAQENISSLRLEKEQIQTENYKAQLKVLRNQIDPHFLFNSLNTLRSMVRQQHANSEKFIISLSDFYRQTLKHNENNTLPLSEELAVLESYLFLMKNRNEEAMSVKIDIAKSLHNLHMPGMALQVVTENCFKHNSMTSKNPLKIEIRSQENDYVEIKNNIQTKLGMEESSGLGLELLRKRYELLNISEGLLVEKSPEEFSVKLKLIK